MDQEKEYYLIGEVSNIESQETLDATLGLYLNQVLYHSTFGKVAVLNDEVVGLILGTLTKEGRTYISNVN